MYSALNEPSPIASEDFFVGKRLTALPIGHLNPMSIPGTSDACIKRFNTKKRVLDQFWSKWENEYFLQLKSAMTRRPSRVRKFSVNDKALSHDSKLPRHPRKLGRITHWQRWENPFLPPENSHWNYKKNCTVNLSTSNL